VIGPIENPEYTLICSGVGEWMVEARCRKNWARSKIVASCPTREAAQAALRLMTAPPLIVGMDFAAGPSHAARVTAQRSVMGPLEIIEHWRDWSKGRSRQ
jgi:hypothetical protein